MQMQYPSKQQQGLLEDLFMTPITHTWTAFPDEDPGFLHGFGDNTYNEQYDSCLASSSTFLELISSSIQPTFDPNLNSFTAVNVSNSSSFEQKIYEHDDKPKPMVSFQEGYPRMLEQEDDKIHDNQIPDDVFNSGEKKRKSKKVEGLPSKNLMAERRRRKRLNDRLSMLRSIVPRISKMDRTSILGDAIEYMKELMEKISTLKGQDVESNFNSLNLIVNEANQRNLPKFEVERRNTDTHVQICCSTKPGMLLSTVNALEVLGLDIQHCVISSFGDFTLQASCSELMPLVIHYHRRTLTVANILISINDLLTRTAEHMMTSSEEIKQILTRNAGYGGQI